MILRFVISGGDPNLPVSNPIVGATVSVYGGSAPVMTGLTGAGGVVEFTGPSNISALKVQVQADGHQGVEMPIGDVVFGQLEMTLSPGLYPDENANTIWPGN